MAEHDPLTDWVRTQRSYDGVGKTIYTKGEGPGVLVMTEIPGITPYVADFSRHVVDQGFTVWMPDLFGEAGRPMTPGYMTSSIAKACISKEFQVLSTRSPGPIADWLRACARDLHAEAGGPGVGAVGMCLTGGFALSLMLEPALIAPVLSQPSLPFGVSPKHMRSTQVAGDDLLTVKRRMEDEDLTLIGLRFAGDPLCPRARFDQLRADFGDRFEGIEVRNAARNPRGKPNPPHSVLTTDLIDEPGQPTYEARERVIALFREKLLG